MSKFSVSLDGIWYTFEIASVMKLIIVFFQPFSIRGRETYLGDFFVKNF